MTTNHQAQVDAAQDECKRLFDEYRNSPPKKRAVEIVFEHGLALHRLVAIASAPPAASELVVRMIPDTIQDNFMEFIEAEDLCGGVLAAGALASSACNPMSKWPFEQPHVARDLLARLYMTMGRVRDAKLEAEIDVFLAATRRP